MYGDGTGVPFSLKFKSNTCFCKEHCAIDFYDCIDLEIDKIDLSHDRVTFLEHETGPEILVYLAVTASSITLSASILNLITAFINRIKRNHKGASFEFIVRTFKKGKINEEKIIKIDKNTAFKKTELKNILEKTLNKMMKK